MNIHTSFGNPCSDWSSCILVPHFIHEHALTHAAACRRGVHVISFPRPAGKCVISFLLLSSNDLINITLYHSTITVPRLNRQNKSQHIKTIVLYNMVRALIVIFGEHVASHHRR